MTFQTHEMFLFFQSVHALLGMFVCSDKSRMKDKRKRQKENGKRKIENETERENKEGK